MNASGPKGVAIERAAPGPGFRHVVTQDELFSFLQNLADWPRWSIGLNSILLDTGRHDRFGYYDEGTIGLRAFNADLTVMYSPEERLRDRDFFEQHARDVEYDLSEQGQVELVIYHLTRAAARAFMLVHVLSHELGHHVDRMSNQLRDCPHGEPFAFRFEWDYAPKFWQTYLRVFGDPRKER